MRTTLDIPDSLFRRAKIAAAEQGITLRALFIQALAKDLKIEKPILSASSLPTLKPKYSTLPIPVLTTPEPRTKQATPIVQAIDEEEKENPPWLL